MRRNLTFFIKFRRVITDKAAEFEVFLRIPPPYFQNCTFYIPLNLHFLCRYSGL